MKRTSSFTLLLTLVLAPVVTGAAPDPRSLWARMDEWDRSHPYRAIRQTFDGAMGGSIDTITTMGEFGSEAYVRVRAGGLDYWLVTTQLGSFAYFPFSDTCASSSAATMPIAVAGRRDVFERLSDVARKVSVVAAGDEFALTFEWDPTAAARIGICNPRAASAARTYHVRSDGFVTAMDNSQDTSRIVIRFHLVAEDRAGVAPLLPQLPNVSEQAPLPAFEEAIQVETRARQGMEPF